MGCKLIFLMYSLRAHSMLLAGTSLAFVALVFPLHAHAATAFLTADTSSVQVGDTVAVRFLLNTEGEPINAAEGDIAISAEPGAITVTQLTTAGSVLSFWPQTPSLSSTQSTVTFIGGTPGGFNQSDALAFTIVFTAKTPGDITFSPARMSLFANDGNATRVSATLQPFTLTVLPSTGAPTTDVWTSTIASDNTEPKNLTAIFGQDSAAYDGKRFVSISAQDDESGVAYFEVQEGDYPAVRSGNVYVLRDQANTKAVVVTAYDNAGNASRVTATAVAEASYSQLLWTAVIIGILLAVIIGIIYAIRKFPRSSYAKPDQPNL